MIQSIEKHDSHTFHDVLSDYLISHGCEIPAFLKERIFRKCFKVGNTFRAVCAVEYGEYILLVQDADMQARTLLLVDTMKKSVNERCLR